MLKSLYSKSDFIKNSFILVLGTGIAQLIPLALQFPLRKFFTPEEFGTFAIYMSITSILVILANFRYSITVVIPKSDDDGINLLVGSILLSFLFSIILLLLFFFIGDKIISIFDFPTELKPWLLLIPLSIFLTSSHLSFSYWLTRKKKFKGLTFNKISRRSAEGASQYGLGHLRYGGGLIIGNLIGDVFNFLTYLIQVKLSANNLNRISLTNIKIQLKRFIDFPKYSLIPTFFDSFSLALPVFMITRLYDESITGQYDLTVKILSAPLALISLAISQVLIQKISELRNDKKPVLKIIINTFLGLSVLSVIGIIIFYFWGEAIFTTAFGEEWKLAGELSTILVFSYAIRFVVSPLTSTFIALERIKISSIWQVLYFFIVFTFYWLTNVPIETFISYYVVADLCAYIIYFILIIMVANQNDKQEL